MNAYFSRSYFSKNGIRYNFGRVPIGGTDFSVRGYTYDEVVRNKTDMGLTQFALQTEDYMFKIPLILEARKLNPEMLFVGAAWSAPTWMKTNDALTGIGNAIISLEYFQLMF